MTRDGAERVPASVAFDTERNDAAQAFLGGLLVSDASEAAEALALMRRAIDSDFRPRFRALLRAMRTTTEALGVVDAAAVVHELRDVPEEGESWRLVVSRLTENGVGLGSAPFHLRRVALASIETARSSAATVLSTEPSPERRAAALAVFAQCEERLLSLDFDSPSRFQVVTAASILADSSLRVESLVDGGLVVVRGLTVLSGSPKSGKSFALLGLAVDLAVRHVGGDVRRDWLGHSVIGSGPSLIVSGEGGAEMLRPRLAALAGEEWGDALEHVHVIASGKLPSLSTDRDVRDVGRIARDLGAVLVAFDPLARLSCLDDENAAGPMDALAGRVLDLAEESNAAGGLSHHASKSESKPGVEGDGATSGRGSNALAAAATSILTLRRRPDRGPGHVSLHVAQRHGADPEPALLRLDAATGRHVHVAMLGAPGGERRAAGGRGTSVPLTRWAEALALGESATEAELAAQWALSTRTVRNSWKANAADLAGQGFSRVSGRGSRGIVTYVRDTGETQ